MVAVVARHAEQSELFSSGERAHPTNERNKLENSVCGTSSDIQPIVRVVLEGCAWLREGREILSSTIHHGCLRIWSSPLARVMISRSLVRDVSRVFSSRRSDDASRRAFQSRRDGRMHSGTECLVHVEMGRFSVSYAFDFRYAMEFVVAHMGTFSSLDVSLRLP